MERIVVSSWEESSRYRDHTDRYELAGGLMQPGSLVLDLACGVGYGVEYLARNPKARAVIGVDNSAEALSHARQHFRRSKTEFLQKNLDDDRALFNMQFDLITCFETLEHLINDRRFLMNCADVLKPGGRFVVSVPNEETFPFATVANPYHYRHYTLGEISSLLSGCGFAILSYYEQEYHGDQYAMKQECSSRSNLFVCTRV